MSRAAESTDHAIFDVGVNEKLPLRDLVPMGFQNVFVMTGIFVFPGIMGRSFNLPDATVASLYAAMFIGCGLTTLLIAGVFGRMPLVSGPYAGIFTALITFGHMPGFNLGTGFGSLMVASLLWALLSIPVRGVSGVSLILGRVKDSAVAGVIVVLVMMQIADLAFPHWIGKSTDPTFPLVNLGVGLVTAIILMSLTISKQLILRRLALLISLTVGATLFQFFKPINLSIIAKAPWFVMPKLFAFGFSVDPMFVLIFFVILVAINIQTMTLMTVVGGWAGEEMSEPRLSGGVLAQMLGSALAACVGGISNIPYPANVAILRSTRVASRQVTLSTAVILIVMGFCTKIDYLFVLLPVPVLAASATVLFGIVFVHGIEMLAEVEWTDRQLAITGFSLMLGFGTLFLEPDVFKKLPLFVALVLRQPIIVGVASLTILNLILPGRPRSAAAPAVAAKPSREPVPHPATGAP